MSDVVYGRPLSYHDNAILIFRGDKIHKLCNYFLQEKDYIYYITLSITGGVIQNKSFNLKDKKSSRNFIFY